MEKTGEMDLYMYVDGRGRMTMPRALRCRTGMGKNSFVRARLDGGVVRLTHVTPREAAQMTEEELLDFIRALIRRTSLPRRASCPPAQHRTITAFSASDRLRSR